MSDPLIRDSISVIPTPETFPQFITVPFKEYLSDILGSAEKIAINRNTGFIIAKMDINELLVHVQFPEPEEIEINPDKSTYLWRIKAWKTSYERDQRIKMFSEKERQERFRREEKILEITKAIQKTLVGLDPNMAQGMAAKLYHTKNETMLKTLGVKL